MPCLFKQSTDYMIKGLYEVLLSSLKYVIIVMVSNVHRYIGKKQHIKTVDNRLSALKPPHLFTRRPRSIDSRKHWKGS